MSSASKRRPRINSPRLVSTVMTAPSASWRRTMGIPTRLLPTTDMLTNIYYEFKWCSGRLDSERGDA